MRQPSDRRLDSTSRLPGPQALLRRPRWLARFEARLGRAVELHPNWLSLLKLLPLTPALLWAARGAAAGRLGVGWVVGLFFVFAGLDYLDGVVARERGLATAWGRVLDRVTDYPLVLGLSWLCVAAIPRPLLAAKLLLDGLLLLLYALGRGSTQNRLRTMLSHAALLALLAVSQGWLPSLVSSGWVLALLGANVTLSSLVVVHNLGWLQRRFVADLLSLSNLVCGLLAALSSLHGHFALALGLLLVGAACDGFDGAAARRWGSTRWGVYSDDLADAVSFAIAPAVAIGCGVGGVTGVALGLGYALFTIARLMFFTLAKGESDPGFFAGVPSTVGAVVVTSAVVLFAEVPAVIGLCVGVACAQMVSFASRHRHIGRALARRPRWLWALPVLALVLAGAGYWGGVRLPVAVLLTAALAYAFLPAGSAFMALLRRRGAVSKCAPPACVSARPCRCRAA